MLRYTTTDRKKPTIVIENDDVVMLVASRVYTIVHVRNGMQYVFSRNIKHIFAELDDKRFFRASKSVAISKDFVSSWKRGDRNVTVKMSPDDTVVIVAQRRVTKFLKFIVEK